MLHKTLTILIALVWLINGLFCKVLNLVPRHREIVARILHPDWAPLLTTAIGLAEIIMCAWVLSRYRSRLCALTQITIVMLMNILEFLLTPDLLLHGRANILWASVFCLVVYFNEFYLKSNQIQVQTADAD